MACSDSDSDREYRRRWRDCQKYSDNGDINIIFLINIFKFIIHHTLLLQVQSFSVIG